MEWWLGHPSGVPESENVNEEKDKDEENNTTQKGKPKVNTMSTRATMQTTQTMRIRGSGAGTFHSVQGGSSSSRSTEWADDQLIQGGQRATGKTNDVAGKDDGVGKDDVWNIYYGCNK